MKFIVDLTLDGYDTDEEMKEACLEFIYEQLDFAASRVKVEELKEEPVDRYGYPPEPREED